MLYNDDDADSDELGVRKSGFKFCEFGGFCFFVLMCFFFLDGESLILLVKKFSLLKAQNNKGYKSLKNMLLIR